jgi:RNA polymerase sigma factor (sigma-70 family)
MNEKLAAELVNKNLKWIKKIIKNKVAIYDLDFKITFKRFVEELKANDYEMVRKIPGTGEFENHLTDMIKNFLVRQAYFAKEEEDFIRKIVTKVSKKNEIPLSFNDEIVTFLNEKFEEGSLIKLKEFKEKSKFTTFLYKVIRNQAIDYVRKYKNINIPEEITVPPEIIDTIYGSNVGPEEYMIREEEETIMNKIAELLPQKVEKLGFKEKIAFKIYYYEDITNLSRIARDLGITRHKADAMIKRAWNEILSEIKKEIKMFLKSKNKPSNKGVSKNRSEQ